jgi:hypothetical protein
VKPQRPSPEIKHTPANAQLQYASTTYNGTLTDIHSTQNIAGKTALCIKYGKCLYLQCVLENDL